MNAIGLVRELKAALTDTLPTLNLAARIARLPVYAPTAAERRAIEKGRAEIARGEYLTVDELFQGLDRRRGKARAKSRRARTVNVPSIERRTTTTYRQR